MNNNRGCGLIAVPIGVLIFLSAFAVIWFNEGRVDLSTIADDSIPILDGQIDPANEGALVAVSSEISSQQTLGDPPYLNPQPYITLDRSVEMYSWTEDCDEDNFCDYDQTWTNSPESISNNRYRNPSMPETAASFQVELASVGAFKFRPSEVIFGQEDGIALTDGMVPAGTQIAQNYIFIGEGSLQSPVIGDIRISYSGFKSNQFGTIFGMQSGEQLTTYLHPDGTILFRGYALDRQAGIAALRTEYLTALWGMRILGLFMFWGGLMMAISPVRRLLSFIPLLGRVGNAALAAIAFAIAFVFWLVTLTISIILNNIIALIVVVLLALGVGYYLYSQQDKEKSPADL